jgi:hypothetical protein
LKGRRDRIPAGEEREAMKEKGRKKHLIFYLEEKIKILTLSSQKKKTFLKDIEE